MVRYNNDGVLLYYIILYIFHIIYDMVLYYTIVKWLLAVYRQTSEFESMII